MKESKCKWVRLGDYITQRREKNNNYNVPIYGVTREGFIPPKQKEADTKLYNTFYLYDFVFNPARMEINSIYLNDFCNKAICSSLYEIFYINDKNVLLPHYLHLFLKREEFARQCEYIGHGSAREYCRISDISDIQIPLPSIEEQQKVVNTWKALREIKEQNEAIAAPLMQVCQSYIQELKHKYESVEIGEYIEEVTRTNVDDTYGEIDVRGVSNDKTMREYKGSLAGRNFKKFLLIKPDEFVFNKRTNAGMGLCLVKERPYIFTEDYEAFRISDKTKLLPDFLYLFFVKPDFDRYILFNSWGSSVIFFHIADMKHVRIPLPPLDVQQSIVNLYNCANEAKKIAEEADKKSREICPALIQYVINK